MMQSINMDFNTILLTCSALVPAVILCVYLYIKDRAEKEPIWLLLLLLAGGAVAVVPIHYCELGLQNIISGTTIAIAGQIDGVTYLNHDGFTVYQFLIAFFSVALIEEGFKWIALLAITARNKNFNSLFDGIIYAVFVSLGFAIVENIKYVFTYGWSTAIIRMFTAVPGHAFNGVIMGYFYSLWHIEMKSKRIEDVLRSEGLINEESKFKPHNYLIMSIVIPVLTHGFYDYCCFMERSSFGGTYNLIFYIFLVVLYIVCFRIIHKMSKKDKIDDRGIPISFINKYPGMSKEVRSRGYQFFNNK